LRLFRAVLISPTARIPGPPESLKLTYGKRSSEGMAVPVRTMNNRRNIRPREKGPFTSLFFIPHLSLRA